MTVEIAVQDVSGTRIAVEEGADRVELCMALRTGGMTPSFGLIQACTHVGVPQGVQALIRPRAGDFAYDDVEKQVQLADVRSAILAGATGVVVGGLTAEGDIDLPFAEQLVQAARDEAERCNRKVQITFHRAFDMVANRFATLEALIDMGYTRVLTSGGAARAIEGLDQLRALVSHAGGRIQIQAGGGVAIDDIPALLDAGVSSVHLSARRSRPSNGGPGGGGHEDIDETDRQIVRAAVAAARRW
ncbi:copper homeostasis protein [Bifidobacterium goeldii]|uniref:PF03932 family protein CutC n=1 Tax=Bifidobacterium goeldii TaxID=2306975 RepID=A0A430FN57_9BIFI|nr:copper homeostasis protein CutC [Bifidobacterium goeldii]RSX54249.1 copper homeostasis protein [Bifidobacterium goeldii]